MIFRHDRGAAFVEPYRQGFSLEDGHVRPSVIEEHPPTARFRNRTSGRPGKRDKPRKPDRQSNRDELDWRPSRGVSVRPAVLPPGGTGPAPTQASRAKSRGSSPRRARMIRISFAMVARTTRWTPRIVSSDYRWTSPARWAIPLAARAERRGRRPPSKLDPRTPPDKSASETVTWSPPFP